MTLQQEGATDIQSGFLFFLPVYRAGAPHASVAERRANLLGWVYSPLRMHDLMQDVLRPVQSDLARPELRLDVYDGDRLAPETHLFTSGTAAVDPSADGHCAGSSCWSSRGINGLSSSRPIPRSSRPWAAVLRHGSVSAGSPSACC